MTDFGIHLVVTRNERALHSKMYVIGYGTELFSISF